MRQSSIVTVGRPSILYFKWIDRQFLSDARKSQSASFSFVTVIMVRASTRASIGSPGAKAAESLVSIAHTETDEVYGLCGTTIFLILMCWCSPRSLLLSRLKQRTLTAQLPRFVDLACLAGWHSFLLVRVTAARCCPEHCRSLGWVRDLVLGTVWHDAVLRPDFR